MNLIASSGVDVANTTYLWIYVALGVIGLVGAAYAMRKAFFKQALRDAAIDQLIHPETGAMAQLAEIKKNLSPNGRNTQGVGDIVARTETAVHKIDKALVRHEGACNQAHQDLQRQIDRKKDKEPV